MGKKWGLRLPSRLSKWLGLGLICFGLVFATGAIAQQAEQAEQAEQADEMDMVAMDMVASLRTVGSSYPGTVHLLPATLETTQWGWFDNAEPPVMYIAPGDTVVVETMMHSHNQVVPGRTIEEIKKLRTDHPGRGPHTLTGPIYVEGAEPGDTLKVNILKIVPRSYATNFNVPGMFGQFPDQFPDGQVKYVYLDMDRKVAEFLPGIEIPLTPFPGTIGVAREEPGQYSSVPPDRYAGNLDIRDMVEGTTLYVPVFVDGALLWTGDSHAAQGNGEINLTALESAFKEIVLNVELIKGETLEWPQIETPTDWITLGVDRDLNEALEIAKSETVQFLSAQRQITPAEAAELMPVVSDCRVSQVVDINKGVHCLNPKDVTAEKMVAYPTEETPEYYVAYTQGSDLNQIMDAASLEMMDQLQEQAGLTRLDAYGLASIAMDCRLNEIATESKSLHCVIPKSLWVEQL